MSPYVRPESLTDELVSAVATAQEKSLDSPEQLEFIKQLASVDVQAAPGCGKTTLIGIKLCALASIWESEAQGVCVLSHTNVAKDQVVSALSGHDHGRRFLTYPHHIGTIQSFADRFLALPYLRSAGIDVRRVDDDFYANAALRLVGSPEFSTMRNYFERQHNGQAIIATGTYSMENGELRAVPDVGTVPGSHTPTGIQYRKLKDRLTQQGILRFLDMYALALYQLQLHPSLKDALCARFPLILIDEMQDTSLLQERFLQEVFKDSTCVIQRVGDVNQAIFSEVDAENEPSKFPVEGYKELPRSLRFGAPIADAATPLTLANPQKLLGSGSRPAHHPILILFDEETIGRVLETFGRLVLDRVDAEELERYPTVAVGARRRSTSNAFPKQIKCYYDGYNPKSLIGASALTLFESVSRAQSMEGETVWSERAGQLWSACSEILYRWKYKIDGSRPSPHRVKRFLESSSPANHQSVRMALLELVSVDLLSESEWGKAVGSLITSIRTACGLDEEPQSVKDYCSYPLVIEGTSSIQLPSDTFELTDGGATLNIRLSTIHAAKGENHAATLVLECYDGRGKIHDLKETLPVIINEHDPKRLKTLKSVRNASRLTFVAMTRPRNLLSFAVHVDHLGQLRGKFEGCGWEIVDLTNKSPDPKAKP